LTASVFLCVWGNARSGIVARAAPAYDARASLDTRFLVIRISVSPFFDGLSRTPFDGLFVG